MKIHPVGAELFHADGQTDRHDEASSRFSQFCEKRLKSKQYNCSANIYFHHKCLQNNLIPNFAFENKIAVVDFTCIITRMTTAIYIYIFFALSDI